jgi:hypothetical protein
MNDAWARKAFLTRRRVMALTLVPMLQAIGSEIERVPRPMRIHRVTQLGLEIWTEGDPEWDARLATLHDRPVFAAETPALAYPPAGMTWTSQQAIRFTAEELEMAARGALHQAARNYGMRNVEELTLEPARYGALSGYESRFPGLAHGTRVDVQVFIGHQPGRPTVLAHAYTLEGKLDHIREHIRRSWTNLRYLR